MKICPQILVLYPCSFLSVFPSSVAIFAGEWRVYRLHSLFITIFISRLSTQSKWLYFFHNLLLRSLLQRINRNRKCTLLCQWETRHNFIHRSILRRISMYVKPEITKHEELTQITFSSH